MLTDSGGYQIYSLAGIRKFLKMVLVFPVSHRWIKTYLYSWKGNRYTSEVLEPISSWLFDECTPFPCQYEDARHSMELTHYWSGQVYWAFSTKRNALMDILKACFPIVQGSVLRWFKKTVCWIYWPQRKQMVTPSEVYQWVNPLKRWLRWLILFCHILPYDKPSGIWWVWEPRQISWIALPGHWHVRLCLYTNP